jgi:hypothetical protein
VRRPARPSALAALVLAGTLGAADEGGSAVSVRVEVDRPEATVGDYLELRVVVTLPPLTRLDPPRLGPALGPFSVVDGSWSGPEAVGEGERWSWSGAVVSYRTGELELPAVRITVEDESGERHEARSEPVPVTILSVLDSEVNGAEQVEIADLKAPASIPADYRALLTAAGILLALLLAAAALWWLHRRYAARLAAVPAPDDPFHRTPPHEWVYAELQKLLERRLAEQGQVTLFFAEIAWIVKRYLGGRYRVELMERTTAEVPPRLRQAGALSDATEAVAELLGRCDMVKFAKRVPVSDDCRTAIEAAYRIVDATKPRSSGAEPGSP